MLYMQMKQIDKIKARLIIMLQTLTITGTLIHVMKGEDSNND